MNLLKPAEAANAVFPNRYRRGLAKTVVSKLKSKLGCDLQAVLVGGSVAAKRAHSSSDLDLVLVLSNCRSKRFALTRQIKEVLDAHFDSRTRISCFLVQSSDFPKLMSGAEAIGTRIKKITGSPFARNSAAQQVSYLLKSGTRKLFENPASGAVEKHLTDAIDLHFASALIGSGAVPFHGESFLRENGFYDYAPPNPDYFYLAKASAKFRARTPAAVIRRLRTVPGEIDALDRKIRRG